MKGLSPNMKGLSPNMKGLSLNVWLPSSTRGVVRCSPPRRAHSSRSR
jgi:hypothetical protein